MTKEQLRAYREIKLEREDLKRRIEQLEAALYGPRSQNLDGMPRSGSGTENDVRENRIEKKDEVLELYRKKEAELAEAVLEVEAAITDLKPLERRLIRLYYLDGLTWEQVAVEMGYCWRHVHRLHGDTLQKLKALE